MSSLSDSYNLEAMAKNTANYLRAVNKTLALINEGPLPVADSYEDSRPAPEREPTYEEEHQMKCREVILIYDNAKEVWTGYSSSGPVKILMLEVDDVSAGSGFYELEEATVSQLITLCGEDGGAHIQLDAALQTVTQK